MINPCSRNPIKISDQKELAFRILATGSVLEATPIYTDVLHKDGQVYRIITGENCTANNEPTVVAIWNNTDSYNSESDWGNAFTIEHKKMIDDFESHFLNTRS